ncbi:hypothetical protein, partial [Holdemania filiformis]|uniref:hypothetical protein n=1 Tax=Holdemania filiformis TaxID=61171 RepID=UPI00242C8BE7
AFYEIFHGTFVFFNDKGHSGGCPASDNQPGLHLKNYRTQKKSAASHKDHRHLSIHRFPSMKK